MNAVRLFSEQAKAHPNRMALCVPKSSWVQGDSESASFSELLRMSVSVQAALREQNIKPGSSVLVFDRLGVRLYASMIALLGMGVSVVFVEPWLSVEKINRIIEKTKPVLFLSDMTGFAWGMRVESIRKIRKWLKCNRIFKAAVGQDFVLEEVSPDLAGIITFTSGTTGHPKGVVRGHGYLQKQCEILSRYLNCHRYFGPDLCVFGNFALLNLACGRGSILISKNWSTKALRAVDQFPIEDQPETLTAGPAFLKKLMKVGRFSQLKSIHIGGAQSDCSMFEEAFDKWPEAEMSHVYGGSEVEPVSIVDARLAVQESRKRGLFQTLYLGSGIAEIKSQFNHESLWVSGPHVCPEYIGNDDENKKLKKKSEDGTLWHCMGDRVSKDESGWWYQGRSGQAQSDFTLEQEIYHYLQSSSNFITNQERSFISGKWLVGEGVLQKKVELRKRFPEIDGVVEAKIIRDPRHQARIDRSATLNKRVPWLS